MAGIKIDFGANVTPFNRAMAGVKNSVSSLASSLGGKLGTALGFTALVYSANRYINKLDEIAKTSKKLGLDTEFYQKISFAAERSGTNTQTAAKGIKILQRNIYELSKGTLSYVQDFAMLGLEYDDLKNKSPEEQFKTVANALNKITDASQKSALSQKILGRAGAELIVMMKDYSMLAAEIESRGLIKDSTIKAAEELSDRFTDIKTSLAALVSESGIFEVMAKGMNRLVESIYEIKKAGQILTESKATGEYASRGNQALIALDDFLYKGFLTKMTDKIYPRAVLSLPSPDASEKEKLKLQKAETAKLKDNEAKQARLRDSALNPNTRQAKEQQLLEKKLLEEETNFKILKAQNSMNEYQFGLFKIIAETDKKIKEARNEQLKKIYAQQGALEIQNYEKKHFEANKEQTIAIREEIELSKARAKLDRKEMSEKEYEIFQTRMQEASDIRKAKKESASSELISAIQEKANLDIQNIIRQKDESMPVRGLFGGSGVSQEDSALSKANKLQEKSLEYQRQAAESLKEIEKKSTHATYG